MTPDDPRHGTRAGYIAGCRESNCRDANRRWVKRYRLNAARNGGSTTVSSGPIRQHVLELQETMSLCSIGAASGTSSSQLSRLLQGQHPRMRSTTAKALLAVRPNAKVGGHYVAAVGAQRRLQALVVIGYSFEHLERLLGGYGRSNIRILAYGGRTWITSDVATRIQKVYDAHWQIPVVGTSRVQRGAVTKVRRRAQAFGWAGPLAWDDDEIDSPDAQPRGLPTGTAQPSVIDEAKIQRRMAGDRTARTRGAESVEVVRRLLAAGHSQHWICEHTGLKTERYMPIIRAAQQAAEQSEPEQVAA